MLPSAVIDVIAVLVDVSMDVTFGMPICVCARGARVLCVRAWRVCACVFSITSMNVDVCVCFGEQRSGCAHVCTVDDVT